MPAFAATGPVNIDFDSLPTGTFAEHQEDGFLIQYIGFGDQPIISDVAGNHVLKDSAYNMYGSEVRITSLDGENFYFNSLDYNNLLNNNGGDRIEIWAFPYPYDWATAKGIKLYPTSSTYSTLTSTALGVDGIEICLLRVNCVSMDADYSVDNINLTPITPEQEVKIPGWLEIEIQDHIGNYGPCFYDGSGQATTLAAWVPHLPPNANREGVAVHEDILFYLG